MQRRQTVAPGRWHDSRIVQLASALVFLVHTTKAEFRPLANSFLVKFLSHDRPQAFPGDIIQESLRFLNDSIVRHRPAQAIVSLPELYRKDIELSIPAACS